MLSATLTGTVDSVSYDWVRTGFEQNGVSRYRLAGSSSLEPSYLEIRHSVRNRNGLVFDVHNIRYSSLNVDSAGKQYPSVANFTVEIPRTSEVSADTEVKKALSCIASLITIPSAGEITYLNDDGVAWLLGDY